MRAWTPASRRKQTGASAFQSAGIALAGAKQNIAAGEFPLWIGFYIPFRLHAEIFTKRAGFFSQQRIDLALAPNVEGALAVMRRIFGIRTIGIFRRVESAAGIGKIP